MNQPDSKSARAHETELFTRRIFEGTERNPKVRYLGRLALHLEQQVWGLVAAESIGLNGETKWIVIRLQDGKLLDGNSNTFRLATPEEEDTLKKTLSF